ALAVLRASTTPEALWPLIFLIYMVLYNFTETTLLQQHNLSWVLYVATVFGGSAAVRRDEAPASGFDPEPRAPSDAGVLIGKAHG
ncbi:MAG: hypothetical protein KY464_01865, partial [Gemmatimonadetes bacterium]|nr:hypothetical protein [Gemmatimonadota bacterium]